MLFAKCTRIYKVYSVLFMNVFSLKLQATHPRCGNLQYITLLGFCKSEKFIQDLDNIPADLESSSSHFTKYHGIGDKITAKGKRQPISSST